MSIVVPVVNEEASLERTLRSVAALSPPPVEVLVVDGGSSDRTLEMARHFPVNVLTSRQRSRAAQMQTGAQAAQGDLLCFLHADTWLPPDAVEVMRQTLSDSRIAAAGFTSLMTGPRGTRWATSFHNFVKSYYGPLLFRPWSFFRRHLRLLFGDQAIFCRRAQFLDVGGFRGAGLMEEAVLCERLCRLGRIVQIGRTVWSSDRRVAEWGFLRAHATYLRIALTWGLGRSTERLRHLYPDIR